MKNPIVDESNVVELAKHHSHSYNDNIVEALRLYGPKASEPLEGWGKSWAEEIGLVRCEEHGLRDCKKCLSAETINRNDILIESLVTRVTDKFVCPKAEGEEK